MSSKDESAFPCPGFTRTEKHLGETLTINVPHSNGLTKLEYIATKMAQGMWSNSTFIEGLSVELNKNGISSKITEEKIIAVAAVIQAEALLKALEEK